MNVDNRIQELIDLAAQEGFILPLSPEQIVEIEDAGYITDLKTGEIVGTNEDWFTLTPTAELHMRHLLPVAVVEGMTWL